MKTCPSFIIAEALLSRRQCAAVSTTSGAINIPPHKVRRVGSFRGSSNVAMLENSPADAYDPVEIRELRIQSVKDNSRSRS